jgi:hypothetical protein
LSETILKRIKTRFVRNLKERESEMIDWDVPTEIYEPKGVNTEINTALVTPHAVLICPTCGIHNHLKNNKFIRCAYGVI